MNRIVLLGVLGVAVIAAALALNFAINRDEPALPQISGAAAPPSAEATSDDGAPDLSQEPAAADADDPGPAAGSSAGAAQPGESDGSTQIAALPDGDGGSAAPETDASISTGAGTSDATGEEAEASAAEPMAPEFDIVRVNPSGEAVIAGRAAPGSEVTVLSGDRSIGTVMADQRGEWVLLPEQKLEPGDHELTAVARLPDQEPMESGDVVVVVVPEPQKDIAGQESTAAGQVLALAVPRDGEGRATVLQAPGASEGIGDNRLFLDSVDYGEKGDVSIGGRADPGADLQVYLDNNLLGTTKADPEGQWRLTPDENVSEGMHDLRVDQIGESGEVVARVETPFQRMELSDWPTQKVVVVQPGNSLWRLARRIYGKGVRYTVIYEANRNQIRDPDLIFPGQVFVVPRDAEAPNADAETGG